MALSDTYMLRDIQRFDNEEILNVYFFQDISTATTAEELVNAWIEDFLPAIVPIQSDELVHVTVDAVNLADPSNFFEAAPDEPGTNTDDPMPMHNAVNFSLRLNSRALRPGSKRYSGVSEVVTTGNFITSGGYLALLETLRLQQFALIGEGSSELFKQIVVKRVPYTPEGAPEGHIAYRLPTDDGEFVFGDVINALVNTRVSHQVSRNNGR